MKTILFFILLNLFSNKILGSWVMQSYRMASNFRLSIMQSWLTASDKTFTNNSRKTIFLAAGSFSIGCMHFINLYLNDNEKIDKDLKKELWDVFFGSWLYSFNRIYGVKKIVECGRGDWKFKIKLHDSIFGIYEHINWFPIFTVKRLFYIDRNGIRNSYSNRLQILFYLTMYNGFFIWQYMLCKFIFYIILSYHHLR